MKDLMARYSKKIGFDLFIEFLAWALIGAAVFFYEHQYFEWFNNWINQSVDKYRGVIILVFALFVYRAIRYLKKISNKLRNLLEEELPLIVSNEDTIFQSSSFKELIVNTNSKLATRHPSWHEKDIEYSKELRNALWIAHTDFANPKEIVGSGTFVFFKEFHIPENIIELKTCDLNLLVDEACSIVINGRTLTDNIAGRKELHYFYIKDYLKKGKNEVRFHVNNEKSDTSIKVVTKSNYSLTLDESDLVNEEDKKMSNWYGLRFCIRITCINN